MQEVVFLADFRCPRCQQRVAEIMAKMNGEAYSTSFLLLNAIWDFVFFAFSSATSWRWRRETVAVVVVVLSFLTTLIWAVVSGLSHRIPSCNNKLGWWPC